ncbi:uncharacterized protein LOC112347443 [Selaginella moellendorffii]|uniref:uncharacterized protein LOC112347443 n=1 Tax=Selaginella moellendorffii TaxID=88036 RepID=UPI000D1CB1E2|nr:uncharacterized protein LOC112347443 [Selaginella moellendorffii]|eukprot:XP_024534105.1 uncharacterized protein LOC112347443 [Selaginella moellendorffii]
MEDHRLQQTQLSHSSQQQPLNWQPLPVAFSGYQMPLRPPPRQMFIPQPVPYYQPDYTASYEPMLGAYPSPYFSQQFPTTMATQLQQQQQQTPAEFQSFYGSYGPAVAAALQSSYPPLPAAYGAPAPPQWPSPAAPWQVNPTGDGYGQAEIHSESSSGRSPNKMQRFGGGAAQAGGGAGRGWKRNRDGSFNNKRPGNWQRNGNFQGSANRPDLRCEPCDRNFVGRNQMDAHMKTHVKCNTDGCLFEGIGKAVSEHRQMVHCKKPAINISKESEEETRKWREARRRNYPTTANIERKLQAIQGRIERGELVDEDALMRQESMKQILARQAELGCQIAEIPSYYLSQRYTEKKTSLGRPSKAPRASEDQEGSRVFHSGRRQGRKICVFFQKGHCKKGRRCHFLHDTANNNDEERKDSRSENAKAERVQKEREPTLLAKLLSSEIKRDKSHLLQCFRFFVNNRFLEDHHPGAPLKLFEWAEDDEPEEAKAKAPPVVVLDDSEEDLEDEDEDEDEIDEEEGEEVDDGGGHEEKEDHVY